jgi:hypothetical protein
MKLQLKRVAILIGLSILMMIFWIIGLFIGNAIFPSSLMDASSETNSSGEYLLLIICLLNTLVILIFIYNSQLKKWKLAGTIFLIAFGIQYFMSQIETFWFNDSLKMPVNLIWAVVFGGAFVLFIFSIVATWLTGNFKSHQVDQANIIITDRKSAILKIFLLAVVIWPIVYFMAGYLIAWQFSEVRNYYSGSTEMASFYSIMKENVLSGLYFFQILRGFLWVLIALLVLTSLKGTMMRKGIILGLLLSLLGSSQLLLPNPIMPDVVRIPHLIETSISSFLWGLILAWSLNNFIETKSV